MISNVSGFEVSTALDEFKGRTAPLLRSMNFLLVTMENDDHASEDWHEWMTSPQHELPAGIVMLRVVFDRFHEHLQDLQQQLRAMVEEGSAQ
jgi:hypothetical protein